ncbi:MAG: protein translocase subunit SecD [Limnochordales bacterium]|nr:protein translocase subunit SecD [Limnochordales bacterium]
MSSRTHLWIIAGIGLLAAGLVYWLWPVRLGLDLKGGVHVVLEAQDTETIKVNEEVMQRAMAVVSRRVDGLGVAEAVVQRQGTRRIIVQLPGVTDQQEALRLIGRTAVLEFRDPEGKVVVTGADLKRATATRGEMGVGWAVDLEFTAEGAKKFADATRRLVGQPIAIYLDEEEISAPRVEEPIPDGRAVITGNFTATEAKNLAMLLNSGALPVPLRQMEVRNVGATLGRDSVQASVLAGVVGALAVVIFMVVFYRIPGLLADVALLLYVLLNLAVLMALKTTFTVPGLAGFILGVGMAVDANVVIFERVKDELRAGKSGRAAVEAGFHRAFAAILDSNVTTLITAVVLFYFGSGPVKGFAVTLSVGIIISMFTAVVVSHWLIRYLVDRNPEKVAGYFGLREVSA